ncbi:MAG: hypothetical protein ABEJ35_01210 [Halobacteriaceae archaeon]
MADEDGLEQRLATVETAVEELQTQLDVASRDLQLLATAVDVDPVDARCPECEDGTLRKDSGLTWSRAVCEDCEASWYL